MSENPGSMRYPRDFEPNTSHANAVTLLDKSEIGPGLVLDLGCGNAPAAEPLAERGFQYVGLDVDRRSLAGLTERGFETHRLDLGVNRSRLTKNLREIVDGRDLAAILALDVLEHVADPRAVVEVLAALAQEYHECNLVVSIPNLTHRDVATRLLLAQWEMTAVGLLDDTHVRFFSSDGLDRLFADTGWHMVDGLDTTAEYTEQYTLLRSPALQPGAPLGDFLRRIRTLADPHSTTYQYVRRLVYDPRPASRASDAKGDSERFLSIVVLGDAAKTSPLLGDLEAQADADFELVVLGSEATLADVNEAVDRLSGHYLSVLDASDRVGPGFVAAFRRGASDRVDPVATDCVVRIDAVAVDRQDLAQPGTFADVIGERVPIEPDGFDLLRSDLLGSTALAAYAVPLSLLRTLDARFEPELGVAAPAVFLARAVELCSLRGVGATEVAVEQDRVREAEEDLDAIRDGLGPSAFLLPPGGVARLAAQRRTLVQSLASERTMRRELDELRPRAISAETERDRLDAELKALHASRMWQAVQLARKVYARGRRFVRERLRATS